MLFEKEFKKLTIPLALLALIVISFFLIRPIIVPLISGIVLAYVFIPFYNKLLKYVKNKNIATSIILLALLILIGFSLWFLIPVLITQSFDMYLTLQEIDFLEIATKVFPATMNQNAIREIVLNFNKFLSSSASGFFSSLTSLLFNLHIIVLKATVVLIVFFFSLRDHEKIKCYLSCLSPFNERVERRLSKNLHEVTNAVIYGTVIVGVIQGLLTGLGLFIFQVPQAIFLTVIAIFTSIIPLIGAWIVWVPASLYLVSSGEITLGVGLAVYGVTLVSWVDNMIRPYFVSKKTNLSTALIFIGMLGGLITFGMIGLILGPLILSYLLVAFETYLENASNQK